MRGRPHWCWLLLSLAACSSKGPGTIPIERRDGGDEDSGMMTPGDGGVAGDGGYQSPYCQGVPAKPCDTGNDCDTGEACVIGGCPTASAPFTETLHCVTGGAACGDANNCCEDPPCSNVACTGNVCVATTAGCQDWHTCPAGFACEEGACTDRRMTCVSVADCPADSTCYRELGSVRSYCRVTVAQKCQSDADCDPTRNIHCVDVLNDGTKRCFDTGNLPMAECSSLADCASNGEAAKTCGRVWGMENNVCTDSGLCADDGDCRSGWACLDVSGFGVKRCLPPGDCSADADCTVTGARCVNRFSLGVAVCSAVPDE